MKSLLRT